MRALRPCIIKVWALPAGEFGSLIVTILMLGVNGGSGGDFGVHAGAIIREVSLVILSANRSMARIDDIVFARHGVSIVPPIAQFGITEAEVSF